LATLVVVDMQKDFGGSQEPWLIKNVQREIRAAKKRRDGIIILQYEGCGRTDRRILRTLGKYPKGLVKFKYDCDGSRVVIKTMKKHHFDMTRVRVVGVYTDACVQETIMGLSDKLRKADLVLVADACNHETRTRRNHGRSNIRRKNIRHVNTNVDLPKNLYNIV